MQWGGARSKVQLGGNSCTLTLAKRKNRQFPTALVRECCCSESGKLMCSVHWLQYLKEKSHNGEREFGLTKSGFARNAKDLAEVTGVHDARRCGTHALRRGMAQDILDMGGSLPALLHAGDWSSSAHLTYLRASQADDVAVARAAMFFSDSEEE